MKNGCEIRLEPPAPLIRPGLQAAASGHQERALRYFSMTQSRDPGSSETEPSTSLLLPTSSAGLSQQEESRREHLEEEEEGKGERDGVQQQGGASEENQESSWKGKLLSPDVRHPERWRRDESKPPTSWSGTDGDSLERGEKGGAGPHPQEASWKQGQERSCSQTSISGRSVCLKRERSVCPDPHCLM